MQTIKLAMKCLFCMLLFSQLEACTSGQPPKSCSNGVIVASYSDIESPGLVIIDLEANNSREIHLSVQTSGISLSPDSKQLVFASGSNLFLMEIESEKVETLLSMTNIRFPVWSPGEKYIAFASITDDAYLYVLDMEQKNVLRLTEDDGYPQFSRDWSPDNQILFTASSTRGDTAPKGETYLMVMRPNGSLQETIYQFPSSYYVHNARISPDERFVLFEIQDENDSEFLSQVILFNLETLQEEKLLGIPPDSHSPVWSPDGTCIAFINDTKIYMLEMETQTKEEILLPEELYEELDWGATP